MKHFKSTTAIVVSILVMFSTFSTAFAVNTDDENYRILIEQGFTEDYLNSLTDSMITEMAETIKKGADPNYISDYDYLLSLGIPEAFIKELAKSSLSQIKSALEGSKLNALDYESEAAIRNTDVPVKTLSLQLTDVKGKSVTGETVCVYWEWPINKPLIRAEDYIIASWNKDFFCYDADTFYAEDYRRNSANDVWTVSDSYSTLAHSSLNSIGHWTKLYTTKKQIGGFMIFNLNSTHPIDSASDYDRDVTIEYTHETKSASTAAICVVFVLLALSALSVIMKIRKRKRK